jgi:hypothetical protein
MLSLKKDIERSSMGYILQTSNLVMLPANSEEQIGAHSTPEADVAHQ